MSLAFAPSNKVGKTISLTVRGSEGKAGWNFPTIRYAIRRFYLNFDIEDCVLPEEDWNIDGINLSEIEIEHQESESSGKNAQLESGWSLATSDAGSTGISLKSSKAKQHEASQGRRYSAKYQPVLAHGDAKAPQWSLSSENPLSPLLGTLIKESHFCRVEPTGIRPKVSVSFTIPYDALLFKKSDGRYISGNKYGIIRLILRAALCEKKHNIFTSEVD